MKGLRELIQKEEKYSKFKFNLVLIEKAIQDKNTNLVIDSSKGLIESVCKTISGDLGINLEQKWDLPKIVKSTVEGLPFIKTLNDTDAEKTKRLCGNLVTLSKTIGEIRNEYGQISHGQDLESSKKADEAISTLSFNVTDILCSFLLDLHANFSDIKDMKRFPYEMHEEFNSWFDELQETMIQIGNLEFRPSKVLYNEDFEAYKEELLNYEENDSQN